MGKKSSNSPPDYRMNLNSLRNSAFTMDRYAAANAIPQGTPVQLTEKQAIQYAGTPAALIEVTFNSGANLRLTTYPLDVTFKGITFRSTADVQDIPKIKNAETMKTDGIKLKLSAINPAVLDSLMNGARDARVTYKLVFMTDKGTVNGDVSFDAYTGFITVTEFNLDAKSGTLDCTVETENILKKLDKIQGHRQANAVQQQLFPNDEFYSLINNQDNSDWRIRT